MVYWMFIINGCGYWVFGMLFVLCGVLQGFGYMFVFIVIGVIELVMCVGVVIVFGVWIGFDGVVFSNLFVWVGVIIFFVFVYVCVYCVFGKFLVDLVEVIEIFVIVIVGLMDGLMVVDVVIMQLVWVVWLCCLCWLIWC